MQTVELTESSSISQIDQIGFELAAVEEWLKGQDTLRNFQACAWRSKKSAVVIAYKIREAGGTCSVDIVEKDINAYSLYMDLLDWFPESAETIRNAYDRLHPSHWIRAAELRSRFGLNLAQIWEHLKQAAEDMPSVAAFAAHIDTVHNPTPMWVRKLEKLSKFMTGFFLKEYASEVPPDKRKQIEAIFDDTARQLTELIEDE